ncbi:MAG: type II toxin-antitoxin system VapC family toxin [Propionibacteriaceae bacterium]|jgi:predicted nucleic acid-binding protein|nr:type II toxin-antitoxin system VapC family toxin [Propionibacteriaceae bacterium]
MIGYFDTSAVVPLVVAEPSSGRCRTLWQACDVRLSSVLVVAEAHAALAMAERIGRLTTAQHTAAVERLGRRLDEIDLAVTTRDIVDRAAQLAWRYALRGYDAVHAATAELLAGDGVVVISGDQALLAAWSALGFDIIDTNTTID